KPKAPPTEDESGEDETEQKCPKCRLRLQTEAALCPGCGTPLQTVSKPPKVYDRLERRWESGMTYRRRMTIFLACQSVMVVGAVITLTSGFFGSFIWAWLVFTSLLAFLLGSYDRVDLTRNKRGQVRLTKTWRICFIAKAPENVPLREYEGIQTGM